MEHKIQLINVCDYWTRKTNEEARRRQLKFLHLSDTHRGAVIEAKKKKKVNVLEQNSG